MNTAAITPGMPGTPGTSELRKRVAVFAAGMCAFFTMYLTQGLLPSLRAVFHAGVAELSLTITCTTLAVAVAAPWAGSLSDRFGRKRTLLVSLAALSATTLLAATAPTLSALLVWRTLQGLCIPGIFTSTVAYIGEEWPAHEAPAVVSLYISGSVAGGFLGRFVAGMATAHFGWRAAFVAVGALGVAILAFIARGLPASRRHQVSASLRDSLGGLPRHLRNPRLMVACGIGFCILFSQVCTFTYVGFHLSAPPYGLGLRQLGLLFAVYLVGMVATPLAGQMARRSSSGRVFGFGVALSALGMVLTLAAPLPVIVLGLTLSSAGVFIAQSMTTALVPTLAREARSSAVGLYVMCYYVGGSVGAFGPSRIWDAAGWGGCVALVLAVQALMALAAWRGWPRRVST